MLRCIGLEIKKNCYLPWIITAVAGIVILCLISEGDIDYSGKSISVLAVIIQTKKSGQPADINKSILMLWNGAIKGWLVVFAPVLLSFGYIVSLSEERQSGQLLFSMMRSGKVQWCVSKVIGGALTGGLVFTVGYILFGILLIVFCPAFSGFSADERSLYMILYFGNSIPLYIAKRLIGTFLYGVFGAAFGIGVAAGFRDKYMLLCLPFLFNYIYQQIIGKIITDRLAAGAVSVECPEAFYPQSVIRISADIYWETTFFLMAAVYLAIIILWVIKIRRGSGEWTG